jgi:hypothetical protein
VTSILVADSVTKLDGAAGKVLVAGSHGGVYAAYLAARAGVRGVILNDAGVGLDDAGVGGLGHLDRIGLAAAAIDHRSARIGNGADMMARGRISLANATAAAAGVAVGMSVREAADRLAHASPPAGELPAIDEARHLLRDGPIQVWAIDSNGLARPEDRGHVLVTGSHGGILGDRPETALKVDARAALYNDAGVGCEAAGISRLAPLDSRGIAAATVAAASARIGDARSTYADGVLSHVNATAARLGGAPGMTARGFVDLVLIHST